MVDTFTLSSLLFYQGPLLCVVICGYVLFAIKKNGLTTRQYRLVRHLPIGCVLAMCGDVICGMIMYGLLGMDMAYYIPAINITYTCLLYNTIIFGEFCIAGLHHPNRVLCTIFRVICAFNLLVIIARFVLVNTHLFVYLDSNGNAAFGPLDDLQTWGCVAAYIIILIICAIKVADRKEYVNKESNKKLLVTSIIVTAGLVIYAATYLPYIIWMANLLAILYIFIGSQSMMIYNDELTSLHNRRKMMVDLKDYVRGAQWGCIFCDVDAFKGINDSYGHKEGDNALMIVASVLDKIAKENEANAYRIGGDEFAVLAETSDHERLQDICDEIGRRMAGRNIAKQLKYKLSVSCGYAASDAGSGTDIQGIIELADQKMYENKQKA